MEEKYFEIIYLRFGVLEDSLEDWNEEFGLLKMNEYDE
jgi:hypothetical protein